MRCFIFGAGAIGMTLAALLHHAGNDVHLIGRGRNLQVLRSSGVELLFPSGRTLHARIPCSDTLEGATRQDMIFLTVKSQDIAAVLEQLNRSGVPQTIPVFCFQNGVCSEELASKYFHHVYGAVVMLAAVYLEDGQARLDREAPSGLIEIGKYPEGIDNICARAAKLFPQKEIRTVLAEDLMEVRWGKLILNLSNAIRAITAGDEDVSALQAAVKEEAQNILQKAGIAWRSPASAPARIQAPASAGSLWQSLVRGVPTEVDYFNGEIVQLGRAFGMPAPLNEGLCRIIHNMEEQKIPPGFLKRDGLHRLLSYRGRC